MGELYLGGRNWTCPDDDDRERREVGMAESKLLNSRVPFACPLWPSMHEEGVFGWVATLHLVPPQFEKSHLCGGTRSSRAK